MPTIRNKKTGEIKVVKETELVNYGVNRGRGQSNFQEKPKKDLKPYNTGPLGLLGSLFGSKVGPVGSGVGALGGKTMERIMQPIIADFKGEPRPKGIQNWDELKQELGNDVKFAGAQTIADIIGGFLGKKVLKPIANKVMGPLKKIKISLPKGVQSQANALNKEINDEITGLLTKAKAKGGEIKTKTIINNLDNLINKYGPDGTNTPEYVKAIQKIKNRFMKEYVDEAGELVKYAPDTKDLLASNDLRKLIGSETWGNTGKELQKTGSGKAAHTALKQTGGDIRDQLTKVVQNTLGDGSKLDELFKNSGVYTKLAKEMSNPLNPKQNIGSLMVILSSLGLLGYGGAGVPGAATAMGAYGVSQVPYANFLAKKLGGTAADTGAAGITPLLKLISSYISKNKEQNAQLPNENIPLR